MSCRFNAHHFLLLSVWLLVVPLGGRPSAELPVAADHWAQLPYPPRSPTDGLGGGITGVSSLRVLNHFGFAGRHVWSSRTRILVAGGGTGDATLSFAAQLAQTADGVLAGTRITHLDASEASVAIARARVRHFGLERFVRFVVGDLLQLSTILPGRSFDVINCIGVIHHVRDPRKAMRQLAGALRPRGILALMIYGPYGRTGVREVSDSVDLLVPLPHRGAPTTEIIEARLAALYAVLRALPALHWLRLNTHLITPASWELILRPAGTVDPRKQQILDAALYDTFLARRQVAMTASEVGDLLRDAGLEALAFESAPPLKDGLVGNVAGVFKAGLATRPVTDAIVHRAALHEAISGMVDKHVLFAGHREAADTDMGAGGETAGRIEAERTTAASDRSMALEGRRASVPLPPPPRHPRIAPLSPNAVLCTVNGPASMASGYYWMLDPAAPVVHVPGCLGGRRVSFEMGVGGESEDGGGSSAGREGGAASRVGCTRRKGVQQWCISRTMFDISHLFNCATTVRAMHSWWQRQNTTTTQESAGATPAAERRGVTLDTFLEVIRPDVTLLSETFWTLAISHVASNAADPAEPQAPAGADSDDLGVTEGARRQLSSGHSAEFGLSEGSEWGQLYAAAFAGDGETCRMLLAHGAGRQEPGHDRGQVVVSAQQRVPTPLHAAAQEGHLHVLDILLAPSVGGLARLVSSTDGKGLTPLHAAAQQGHAQTTLRLLRAGADSNAAKDDGATPLHAAAASGDQVTAQHLLDYGANASRADAAGNTPLHIAVFAGHATMVSLLLNGRVDGIDGNNARSPAAGSPAAALAVASINAMRRSDGGTPLHVAVFNGKAEDLVLLLLRHGADPDRTDRNGLTPLHAAVLSEHWTLALILVEAGADAAGLPGRNQPSVPPDIATPSVSSSHLLPQPSPGMPSPLFLASAAGQDLLVLALLEADAPIDWSDAHGRTALHAAVSSGYDLVVAHLLNHGADPHRADNFGVTPMILAEQGQRSQGFGPWQAGGETRMGSNVGRGDSGWAHTTDIGPQEVQEIWNHENWRRESSTALAKGGKPGTTAPAGLATPVDGIACENRGRDGSNEHGGI